MTAEDTAHDLIVRVRVLGDGRNRQDRQAVVDAINAGTNADVVAVMASTWGFSVQPEWCLSLPLQQQSVLLLAARGPDGIPKTHPCKDVQRAYRGTVLVAAARRRALDFGEKADSFMSLDGFANDWTRIMDRFFESIDELPHHFVMHLLHGAEILGYKHPSDDYRLRWGAFYFRGCEDMHVTVETEDELDRRLNDVFGPEREA